MDGLKYPVNNTYNTAKLGMWPGFSPCFGVQIRLYYSRSYLYPTCGSINDAATRHARGPAHTHLSLDL